MVAHAARIRLGSAFERASALVALLSLAAAAGCQSSAPLDNADGSSAPGDGLANADGVANTDGGPDVGACGDPYADSSTPFAPCGVDSDCHNGFLVCAPPSQTTTICRDADDAAVVDACPAPVNLADVPICPQTAPVTFNVCNVRYQLPCKVDADCGPDGFTCASGACQQQPGKTCATPSECPAEWDCSLACGCPGEAKACHPPFAEFRCPNCFAPVDGG
jgi:hypothetical protein